VGLSVAAHGSQKLFGWFNGPGIDGFTGMLQKMGMKPARGWAYIAALSEFGGGLAIALGFLTPFAAMAVFAAMLMAITVHMGKGFFSQTGGYEYPLLLGSVAFTLAIVGPGILSLDALLRINLAGTDAMVAAFLLAVAGVVLALESRRLPDRRGVAAKPVPKAS